jgi:hypothetical protein
MSTNTETTIEKKVGAQLPPQQKYKPFPPVVLKDRTWPDKIIDHALTCAMATRRSLFR